MNGRWKYKTAFKKIIAACIALLAIPTGLAAFYPGDIAEKLKQGAIINDELYLMGQDRHVAIVKMITLMVQDFDKAIVKLRQGEEIDPVDHSFYWAEHELTDDRVELKVQEYLDLMGIQDEEVSFEKLEMHPFLEPANKKLDEFWIDRMDRLRGIEVTPYKSDLIDRMEIEKDYLKKANSNLSIHLGKALIAKKRYEAFRDENKSKVELAALVSKITAALTFCLGFILAIIED